MSSLALSESQSTRIDWDGDSEACRKALTPRRRLKETRHTFATLALIHGVPVKVVSEALGHASVKMTYDAYAHVVPGTFGEAFSYLDRLVEGL